MPAKVDRVWRAAPATLVVVWLFVAVAAAGVPALAWRIYTTEGAGVVAGVLLLLAVVAVVYAWRYGLLPSLRTSEQGVTVRNPWRRAGFGWDDLTVVAAGEDGVLVGSDDRLVEAWCVQKTRTATRRRRRTRADRVVGEIHDVWDVVRRPVVDPDTGLTIRRARPDQAQTLMQLERDASLARLRHVFPPDRYPYPRAEIRRRWDRLLRSRHVRVFLGVHDGAPVGYLAYTRDTVRHLGVHPDHFRRGFGAALLGFATDDMGRLGTGEARLWVLSANAAAVDFYLQQGWTETGRSRDAEYPPYPEEVEMVLDLTAHDAGRR